MTNEFQAAYLGSRKERIIYNEEIGGGSYGKVRRAEWRDINGKVMIVAAKQIHEEFLNEKEYGKEDLDHFLEEIRKECETLRRLDHPNIVKIFKFGFKPPAILMELMHCDLNHYIKKSTSTPKVSQDKVVSIALGVAKGLKYLHGQEPSIVLRDLTSKNILLTEEGHPKIAELGLAKLFPFGQGALATSAYAAPETLVPSERAKYGPSVDIFSFGVVLLEMSVGHEPRVLPVRGTFSEIKKRKNDIDEMEDDGKLKRLVIKCLQDKSSSRPNASTLVTKLEKIKEGRRQKVKQAPTFERLGQKPAHDYNFKVLLLGNRNVGKSSLFELRNSVFDIDTTFMKPTLAIRPAVHYFKYNDNNVRMNIVDTAGEERFFSLTSSYYRDVDGVFLVYDVSDKVSFRSLPFWIENLKKYNSKENLQMLLVGNKVDLRPTTNADDLIPREHAVQYATNIDSPFVETSARDSDSVTKMYEKMAEILMSTVSPEDVSVEVRERAKSTIRLPSSTEPNSSQRNKCACRKS